MHKECSERCCCYRVLHVCVFVLVITWKLRCFYPRKKIVIQWAGEIDLLTNNKTL